MALLPDQHFSTFFMGGDLVSGDIIVGLRGGVNTQFNWTGSLPPGIVVPISQGGTGGTTAAEAITNLGLGTMAVQNANAVAITGGVAALTSLTLTTPLAGAYGGTGVNNAGLTINLGTATSGFVMTSDSSGNATWQAPAYLTGAVLLSPSGNQTITADSLIVAAGNLQAGSSGHAGTVASFPASASKGSLALVGVANTGNTVTTISNAAMGQASVVSIPDPGTATANFVLDTGITNMAAGSQIIFAKANGTESTGVITANGQAGIVTTSSLTTAAGATTSITFNNSFITSTSAILVSIMGGTNMIVGAEIGCNYASPGVATINITNNSAGGFSFNGTQVLGYVIL